VGDLTNTEKVLIIFMFMISIIIINNKKLE